MRAISYPFTITPTGKVSATGDFNKIYLDRVVTLISTIANQRFMRTGYGIDLKKALFENTDVFPDAMESAIREAMGLWLPEVGIITINIADPNEEGLAEVEMYVSLPNGENKTLNFKTFTINPNGLTTYVGSY